MVFRVTALLIFLCFFSCEKTSKKTKATAREEFDASNKSLDATQLYLGEIGFSPLLSAEEEVLYARRALRGDEAARKRMIESNLRLVVKISRRRGCLCGSQLARKTSASRQSFDFWSELRTILDFLIFAQKSKIEQVCQAA